MADDDQKKTARERMRRCREELKNNSEIARIAREIKLLQQQRDQLRIAQLMKRGCQQESLAASLFEPLVAEHVAEPFTPRKQGAKHERSPNLPSGNGREKSGKPLEPQASPTSKSPSAPAATASGRISLAARIFEFCAAVGHCGAPSDSHATTCP